MSAAERISRPAGEEAQRPVDFALRGGTVVTCDAFGTVARADVFIDDGVVVEVGASDRPAETEVDARGHVIIPGMHNLHDHLRDLNPGTAAGDGLKLDEMLRTMWRLSETAGVDEYRIGAALGTAKLLRSGVTSVVDHIYPFHRPGLAEAAVEGYSASGIRWFMARGVMTKGYPPICETPEAAFSEIERLASGVVPRDRLMIAPVSLRQAEPEEFRRAAELARELGLRLYTHIAETGAEVQSSLEVNGRRPVELMHDLGFAGPDAVLVHCVQLTEQEIALLAGSGSHVVHCPTNHMKLAKGVTPVPALLAAGSNVALGADIMTDLLTEVRQEIFLQGLHAGDPSIISPQTALRMATLGGARALGLGEELGTIEVGRRADLVCLDLRRPGAQPVLDPVWTVAHRAEASDVVHVFVDGRQAVRDGELVHVDEQALLAEAHDVLSHYHRRAGIPEELMALE